MREVRLIAISDDGTHLILSGDDDERLALQIDESLQAAIRGDRARLGQLEIQLENQLRPRDIQARIRAGESVDAVAAVAGMPLEKVRRFASPVLAEREHIAGRARQATIRRAHSDGPPRVLDDAAAAAAAATGADPDTIQWDAWRRDDGRWQVTCAWQPPGDETGTTAVFSFDPSGRSVLADDDTARVVAGDLRPEPEPVQPEAVQPETVAEAEEADAADAESDARAAPVRLSVVPAAPDYYPVADEDLQATLPQGVVALDGTDASSQAASASSAATSSSATSSSAPTPSSTPAATPSPAASASSVDERRQRRAQRGRQDHRRREADLWGPAEASSQATSSAPEDAEATSERLHLSDIASRVEVDDKPETTPEPAPRPKPAKPARSGSKSRRPSVPTWDEIMFGRRKSD